MIRLINGIMGLALALTVSACAGEQDPGLQPNEPEPGPPPSSEVQTYEDVIVVSGSNDQSDLRQIEKPTRIPTEEDARILFLDTAKPEELYSAWTTLEEEGEVWVQAVGSGCLPPALVTASGPPVSFTVKEDPKNDTTSCYVAVTHYALVAVPK